MAASCRWQSGHLLTGNTLVASHQWLSGHLPSSSTLAASHRWHSGHVLTGSTLAASHWWHSSHLLTGSTPAASYWWHSSHLLTGSTPTASHWWHSGHLLTGSTPAASHWWHSGHLLLHTDSTPGIYSLVTLWLLTDGQYLLAAPPANYLLACHDWYTYNSTEHSISSLQPAQWQYSPPFPWLYTPSTLVYLLIFLSLFIFAMALLTCEDSLYTLSHLINVQTLY